MLVRRTRFHCDAIPFATKGEYRIGLDNCGSGGSRRRPLVDRSLVAIVARRFWTLAFLIIANWAGHSRSTATASVWMRAAPWSVWMILADPTCALASSADHLEPQRE